MSKNKDKKQPKTKTKQVKLETFNNLEPAIVDGKLLPCEKLAFRRGRNYELITIVSVKQVNDDGGVTLWDETLEQCFLFNINTDTRMHDRLKIFSK